MLFRLTDVYKSFGSQDVLRGTSFQINPGEHVGLVGRNGAGKTTIFRLVNEEETPDSGEVARARGLKLGLLAQHVHFDAGSTVHESALAAFGHLQQIEHEMHELEHRMADAGQDLDKILSRYSDLQHEFEREGGFEYSAKAEAILQGLGFDRETWQMETEKLSGGQQNRLGLACLLLSEPDVLLLDEPTNHLDVSAVEWLEEFLQTYPSAFVIISHDRYFLHRACVRIIEMELGRATSYNGNYSDTSSIEEITIVAEDRKSTRLNSSHGSISYAVFCLKKKTPGGDSDGHPASRPRGAVRRRLRAATTDRGRVPTRRPARP